MFGISLPKKNRLREGCKVTVLIPAYNEADVLPLAIDSLKNQTLLPSRIVVIDDGSKDETFKVALESGVEVIRHNQPSGSKAKAVNRVLSSLNLDTPYIAIIDADTILEKNAFLRALSHFKSDKVGAVCGRVLSGQTKTIWQKARFIEYLVGGVLDKGSQEWWGNPLIMAGCFTVWRTDLFLRFEGFPEGTFTEDLDLSWRLIGAGYRVVYASEAICWTIDPQDFRELRSQLLRWRRGFLENIALHWQTILKRPKMAFFIFLWVLGVVVPIGLPLYLLISQNWMGLGILFGSELTYLGMVSFLSALSLGYSPRIVGYVFHYWLVKPVSLALFLEAVIKEVTKETLAWGKTRQKGEIEMYGPPGVPLAGLLRIPALAILTIALLVVPHQVGKELGVGVIGVPEATITFTFDDGWESVYIAGFPALQRCGAMGTVFVLAEVIGQPGYLSSKELRELYKRGWEIASHSLTHRDLTQLSDEEIREEVANSKTTLEAQGFPVFSFSSPYGRYNERTIEAIRHFYFAHRTLDPGINPKPIDPYRILAYDANRDGLQDLNLAFELILKAKETKGHLVFVFHKIDEEGDSSFESWRLEAICKFARDQGFQPYTLITRRLDRR